MLVSRVIYNSRTSQEEMFDTFDSNQAEKRF